MLDEYRRINHYLVNTITKNSKYIIMNKKCYSHFCEWAKLWYGKECYPDKFNDVPIVLDLYGSTYLKVVGLASDEFSNSDTSTHPQ